MGGYDLMVAKMIFKEVQSILCEEIEGVSLLLNEENLTDIQALIIGPKDTPFENAKFRVRLLIPSGYPCEPPKGFFLTKIFHPNIHPITGEICVDTLKKAWVPTLGLRHILLAIRCLLIIPNPESSLNEEAGRLLLEDYDEYAKQAIVYTDIHALKQSLKAEPASNLQTSHNSASLSSFADSSKSTIQQTEKKNCSSLKIAMKRL